MSYSGPSEEIENNPRIYFNNNQGQQSALARKDIKNINSSSTSNIANNRSSSSAADTPAAAVIKNSANKTSTTTKVPPSAAPLPPPHHRPRHHSQQNLSALEMMNIITSSSNSRGRQEKNSNGTTTTMNRAATDYRISSSSHNSTTNSNTTSRMTRTYFKEQDLDALFSGLVNGGGDGGRSNKQVETNHHHLLLSDNMPPSFEQYCRQTTNHKVQGLLPKGQNVSSSLRPTTSGTASGSPLNNTRPPIFSPERSILGSKKKTMSHQQMRDDEVVPPVQEIVQHYTSTINSSTSTTTIPSFSSQSISSSNSFTTYYSYLSSDHNSSDEKLNEHASRRQDYMEERDHADHDNNNKEKKENEHDNRKHHQDRGAVGRPTRSHFRLPSSLRKVNSDMDNKNRPPHFPSARCASTLRSMLSKETLSSSTGSFSNTSGNERRHANPELYDRLARTKTKSMDLRLKLEMVDKKHKEKERQASRGRPAFYLVANNSMGSAPPSKQPNLLPRTRSPSPRKHLYEYLIGTETKSSAYRKGLEVPKKKPPMVGKNKKSTKMPSRDVEALYSRLANQDTIASSKKIVPTPGRMPLKATYELMMLVKEGTEEKKKLKQGRVTKDFFDVLAAEKTKSMLLREYHHHELKSNSSFRE